MFLEAPNISLVPITVRFSPFPEIDTTESGEFRSLRYVRVPLSYALSFHAFLNVQDAVTHSIWFVLNYTFIWPYCVWISVQLCVTSDGMSITKFNNLLSHLYMFRFVPSPLLLQLPKMLLSAFFLQGNLPTRARILAEKISRKRNCWIIRNLHC